MGVRSGIFDIVMSKRKGLPTFGKSEAVFLSWVHYTQIRVPEGFSHIFVRFSDTANYEIKLTDYYDHCDWGRRLWTNENVMVSRPIGDLTAPKKGVMASLFTALYK